MYTIDMLRVARPSSLWVGMRWRVERWRRMVTCAVDKWQTPAPRRHRTRLTGAVLSFYVGVQESRSSGVQEFRSADNTPTLVKPLEKRILRTNVQTPKLPNSQTPQKVPVKRLRRIIEFLNVDIWQMPTAGLSPVRRMLMAVFKTVVLAVRFFTTKRVMMQASALTYSTLLAIVPIVAVVFAIARGFGYNKYIEVWFRDVFASTAIWFTPRAASSLAWVCCSCSTPC